MKGIGANAKRSKRDEWYREEPRNKQTPLKCECGSRRGVTLWCEAYTGGKPCSHGEKQSHIVKVCGCCGKVWSKGNPLR